MHIYHIRLIYVHTRIWLYCFYRHKMYWQMYKYIILDEESYRISRETHLCADTLRKDVFYEYIHNGRKKTLRPLCDMKFNSMFAHLLCVSILSIVNIRIKQDSIIRARVYYMHYNEVCLVLLDRATQTF